jgi:hypothetical protein
VRMVVWVKKNKGACAVVCDDVCLIASSSSVLALSNNNLFSTSATAEADRARLEWVNNTGLENDFFTVEKLNAVSGDFDKIELINSKNSDKTEHYVAYDNAITEGDNIYRVVVTSHDGTHKASDLMTVNFKGLDGVRVFPNPVDDVMQVDLSKYKGEAVSLQLFNQFGQQVQFMAIDNAAGAVSLDVAAQQTGQYILRISANGKRDVMKKVTISK